MASVSQLEGHRDFQHGDPKPLGMFGAPACHCTSIVLALCVSLSGLMLAGTGACICGFLWHDMTPKILGLALMGIGLSMMLAGFVMFLYDGMVKKRKLQESTHSLTNEVQMQTSEGGCLRLPPTTTFFKKTSSTGRRLLAVGAIAFPISLQYVVRK
ncbi:hypothetical protein M514_04616 [Trichuris suis]|uniref:Uncharacterized protein n=1 Tax=Trichuris suis TaxID=68888 RepID=A0A085MB73_9BILA|nr:hypothetical protein M513_04616 [Trichuris suis]KFD73332.1 hypothetical protein M514_04616 [Trichuris suis]